MLSHVFVLNLLSVLNGVGNRQQLSYGNRETKVSEKRGKKVLSKHSAISGQLSAINNELNIVGDLV